MTASKEVLFLAPDPPEIHQASSVTHQHPELSLTSCSVTIKILSYVVMCSERKKKQDWKHMIPGYGSRNF